MCIIRRTCLRIGSGLTVVFITDVKGARCHFINNTALFNKVWSAGVDQQKGIKSCRAFFAPLEGNGKIVYLIYQISNVIIILFPLFLKICTTPPLFIIALFVYALGVTILLASTISFAKPSQSGININGIYKVSRNPMYMGYFIYFLGCTLLTRSLFLLISLIVFVISSHRIILAEERWCIGEFGEEYVEYMKRVRRYI